MGQQFKDLKKTLKVNIRSQVTSLKFDFSNNPKYLTLLRIDKSELASFSKTRGKNVLTIFCNCSSLSANPSFRNTFSNCSATKEALHMLKKPQKQALHSNCNKETIRHQIEPILFSISGNF